MHFLNTSGRAPWAVVLWLAVLGALWSPSASAASAPEWLKPFLAPEVAAWEAKSPVVTLLQRCEVTYLAPDRCAVVKRGALRANTEDGSRQLSVLLPYETGVTKITGVKAWIVSAKGKVISVSKSEFIDVNATGNDVYWNNQRALTYHIGDKAEPGAILAWEYTYETPLNLGEISWGFGVHVVLYRGELEVHTAPNSKLVWHARSEATPPPTEVTPGTLSWKFSDVLPMRGSWPEGYLPRFVDLRVRCVPNQASSDHVIDTWDGLSRWWYDVFNTKAVVDPSIQNAVAAELKDKKTRWERIRALTQYVQRKISYLSLTEDKDVFAACRPHRASDVLAHQLGDCKDKVTLLMALLRAAGDDAYPILLAANNPTAVQPDWPGNDFNHVIAAVPSDADAPAWWPKITGPDGATYVLFDPTARTLPLGSLPPTDQGGRVLLLAPKNGGLAHVTGNFAGVPPVHSTIAVLVKPDGSAHVTLTGEFVGTEGAMMQANLDQAGRDEFTHGLERSLNARSAGVRGLHWKIDWDPVTTRAVLQAEYDIPGAGRRVGNDQMLFTPPFAAAHTSLSPWNTSYPGLSWLARIAYREEIRVTFPTGAALPDLPSPLTMQHGDVEASLSYANENGTLVCTQSFTRPAGLYEKTEYERLRQIGEKISTGKKRPIILKVPALPSPAVAASGGA